MKRTIAIFVLLAFAISCGEKSEPKQSTVKIITAIKATSINATYDYKQLQSIGILNYGQSAVVLAEYGDYVKVNRGTNEGYIWTALFGTSVSDEVINELGYEIGDILICTNKSGASIKDKPSKTGKTIATVRHDEDVTIIGVAVTYYRITVMTENGERTGWVYAPHVDLSFATNK